jgi:hypothetical protein
LKCFLFKLCLWGKSTEQIFCIFSGMVNTFQCSEVEMWRGRESKGNSINCNERISSSSCASSIQQQARTKSRITASAVGLEPASEAYAPQLGSPKSRLSCLPLCTLEQAPKSLQQACWWDEAVSVYYRC